MAINHEIEFKQLLTPSQYNAIKTHYFADDTPFTQTNHYFDTTDMTLKQHHAALRIREKDGQFEMTLKVPADVGLLEYNEIVALNPNTLETLHVDDLPQAIRKAINALDDNITTFHLLGALSTARIEKNIDDNLLVLDHSTYLDTEDFELEFEVVNAETGFEAFQHILRQFDIESNKPDNKVARFFNRKMTLLHQRND